GAEPAVLPYNIHLPGAVDLGGRQARGSQVACYRMRQDGCDHDRPSIAQAAIGRRHGLHACLTSVVHGYDDRTVRLDDWLAAERPDPRYRGLGPREATVPRGRHVQLRVAAHVVVFGVAIAVEGAGGCVVTDGPVLIQVAASRDDCRVRPMEAAVSRTAH